MRTACSWCREFDKRRERNDAAATGEGSVPSISEYAEKHDGLASFQQHDTSGEELN